MDEPQDEEYLLWPETPPWRYKLAFSRHPVQGWYVGTVEDGAVVDRHVWREPPQVPTPTAMRIWLEGELVPSDAAGELVSRFVASHPALFDVPGD
jgi:hypothetical protein